MPFEKKQASFRSANKTPPIPQTGRKGGKQILSLSMVFANQRSKLSDPARETLGLQ
jgi:hypothetical protein